MQRGQGALEYLLLIGGAVLVAGVVIVLILGVSGSSGSSAQSIVRTTQVRELMTQGGTGWWAFDGTATDNSGNNNGTANSVSWVAGKYGQAGQFDGSNSYITVPDSATLDSPYITLAAWVYPTNFAVGGYGYPNIIGKREPTDQYIFRFQDSTGVLEGFVGNGTNWTYSCDSAGVIPLNKWSHVAMTYDGASMKFYINGQLDPSVCPYSGQIGKGTQPLWIGACSACGTNERFQGKIDEATVFNRALGASEIQALAS